MKLELLEPTGIDGSQIGNSCLFDYEGCAVMTIGRLVPKMQKRHSVVFHLSPDSIENRASEKQPTFTR
jgi:hypothetical protein